MHLSNMKNNFLNSKPEPFFILGPCVLESRELALSTAGQLAEIAADLETTIFFKSSFDKANRSSKDSFRGPGLELGLKWLEEVKNSTGLSVVTDIHLPEQAAAVAEVVDVIQIPALLCRQTDLLLAAAGTGKIVNIKKGQFMAPWDMNRAVDKLVSAGHKDVWLTERGTTFGYNNLVVDFKSLPVMARTGFQVIFDATHSVQLPGALGSCSGGEREYVPVLARAGMAAGFNGIFMEIHPDPERALCDGPNSWPLIQTRSLLEVLLRIRRAAYA